MVTKIIEEQAKTNKAVSELSSQVPQKIYDEVNRAVAKYETKERVEQIRNEIGGQLEELKQMNGLQQATVKDLKNLYQKNFEAIDHKLILLEEKIKANKADQL